MDKKIKKRSTNLYREIRDSLSLSREEAAEKLHISSDKLERIENRKQTPVPIDIINMADEYKYPHLCDYYCSNECEIGKRYAPKVYVKKDFSQLILELISHLNAIENEKNDIINIGIDNQISKDEIDEFIKIQEKLDTLATTIHGIKILVDEQISKFNDNK